MHPAPDRDDPDKPGWSWPHRPTARGLISHEGSKSSFFPIVCGGESRAWLLFFSITLILTTGCEDKRSVKFPDKGTKVAIIGLLEDAPGWKGMHAGAAKYFAGIDPLEVTTLLAEGETPPDIDKLIERVEQEKFKAAVIHYPDHRLAPLVAHCKAANMFAVTVGETPAQHGDVFASIELDWLRGVEKLAENLAKAGAGRSTAVFIGDSRQTETRRRTQQRLLSAIESSYEIRIFEQIDLAETNQSPVAAVDAILKRYREVSLLITLGCEPWRSATAADWDRWRSLNTRFQYVAVQGSIELADDLRNDRSAEMLIALDAELGAEAARFAVEGVIGTREWGTSRLIECELVTRERLSDFLARYQVSPH